MRTIFYLLIALLMTSCVGKQQKTENRGNSDTILDSVVAEKNIKLLEEQYAEAADLVDKLTLLGQIGKSQAESMSKEEFSDYFITFKNNVEELVAEINKVEVEYLYNRYGYFHNSDGEKIAPPDWVAEKEARYAKAGLHATHIGEGFEEFCLADDYFRKNFHNKLSQEYIAYLALEENEGKIVSDGGLIVPYKELATEILRHESFIASYPNSKKLNEINERYLFYQYVYLNGLDNSPIRDKNQKLLPEIIEEFKRFTQDNPNSPTTELVEKILHEEEN